MVNMLLTPASFPLGFQKLIPKRVKPIGRAIGEIVEFASWVNSFKQSYDEVSAIADTLIGAPRGDGCKTLPELGFLRMKGLLQLQQEGNAAAEVFCFLLDTAMLLCKPPKVLCPRVRGRCPHA